MTRPAGFLYYANAPIAGGSYVVQGSTAAPNTNPDTTAPTAIDYVLPIRITGAAATAVLGQSLRGSANAYDDLCLFYNQGGILVPIDYWKDDWTYGPWSTANGITLWHKAQAPVPNYATLYGQDGFARTVANGWGTAPAGGTWSVPSGYAATSFSVAPGAGAMVTDPTAPYILLPSINSQDQEIVCKIAPQATGVVDQGVLLRVNNVGGTNNLYQANCYPSAGVYRITMKTKTITGASNTQVTLDDVSTGVSSTNNPPFWLRFKVVGTNPTTLSLKFWLDGQQEPLAWTRVITDSTASVQTSGAAGCIAYISTGTGTCSFSSLLVTSPAAPGIVGLPDGTQQSGGYVLAWGAPGPQAHRNPKNTYPLFDDFLGTSLDGATWNTEGAPNNPTIAVTGSVLTLSPNGTAGDEAIASIGTFGQQYLIQALAKMPGVTAGYMVIENRPLAGGTPYLHMYPVSGQTIYQVVSNSGGGDSNQASNVGTIDANWHTFGLTRDVNGYGQGFVDGVAGTALNAFQWTGAQPVRLMINTGATANMQVDHVRVRPQIPGTESLGSLGPIQAFTRRLFLGGGIPETLRGGMS